MEMLELVSDGVVKVYGILGGGTFNEVHVSRDDVSSISRSNNIESNSSGD